jgi:hypothetical protein
MFLPWQLSILLVCHCPAACKQHFMLLESCQQQPDFGCWLHVVSQLPVSASGWVLVGYDWPVGACRSSLGCDPYG